MKLCFNKKIANIFPYENTDGFQVRVMKNSQTLRINTGRLSACYGFF